ncbi:MAG: tyrosine--tRNA ligase [Candidatus Omnitrophica bacterium]|nr:tyrosine--tRNA ligase [Candidatus Omnitrophota bacterium]
MSTDIQKQLEILGDGIVDLITPEEFENALRRSTKEKRPLRIKYGADPSAADLHLGHTVVLRKLKQFQDLGHLVVFLIGDFTARIGDPSQRSETRPMLSEQEVLRNAKTYETQVFKILDRGKTEVRYNSEWLGKMTPADFLNLTAQYTVARILERDDFQKRYRGNKPIALIEFLYPLLQGYDSVVLKSDVEIGGTDQKFNLLVGRELQRVWNQTPQIVMTLPLLEGTDGTLKMSKSYNNYIAIQDFPQEMFGKVMSIPDFLIERYFRYVSGMSPKEYQLVISELLEKNPRDAKAKLAEQIVSLYHGPKEAEDARQEFDRIFRDKGLPDEIPVVSLSRKFLDLPSLLMEAGLVTSKNEARRLIMHGGVKVDGQKVTDSAFRVELNRSILIQCGKRKFAKVEYHV